MAKRIESEIKKFLRKVNYLIDAENHTALVCVWRILHQEEENLKRRTDPVIKERNKINHDKWRKNNPERIKEINRKSYKTNMDKRRLEKRMERLDPIKHEKKKEILRKSYYKHRDKRLEECKIKNNIRKMQVMLYYSNGVLQCNCCGELEREFLSLDHIEGRKPFNHPRHIGGSRLVDWIIKNNYPEGFRVLCFNCNFARGKTNNKDGLCPHERLKNKNKMIPQKNNAIFNEIKKEDLID